MKKLRLLPVLLFSVFAFSACNSDKEAPKPESATSNSASSAWITCTPIPSGTFTFSAAPSHLMAALNCNNEACIYTPSKVYSTFYVEASYDATPTNWTQAQLQGIVSNIANLAKTTYKPTCSSVVIPINYTITVVQHPTFPPGFSTYKVDVTYDCCNGKAVE